MKSFIGFIYLNLCLPGRSIRSRAVFGDCWLKEWWRVQWGDQDQCSAYSPSHSETFGKSPVPSIVWLSCLCMYSELTDKIVHMVSLCVEISECQHGLTRDFIYRKLKNTRPLWAVFGHRSWVLGNILLPFGI